MENVVLTCAFVLYSNRNVNFLGERIKILEWIFRSLSADKFFQLPDVILIRFNHRVNIFSLLVLFFKVVLFNGIIVFVNLSLEVLFVMTVFLLSSKFTFNLGYLGLELEFVCILTFIKSTAIVFCRVATLTSISAELCKPRIRRAKSRVI